MKKWFIAILAVLLIGGTVGWFSLDQNQRNLIATLPTDANVLFWTTEQRDAGFRALDSVPALAEARVIKAGGTAYPLPTGEPITLPVDVDAYIAEQRHAALVIVLDGKIVLEKYGLDFGPEGRWTSFSVAKSFTSTLVGAAIKDGHITSVDDPVTDYIEGLKGSAYDGVSIRQLLTMTSGVQWNEDYGDPNSDVAKFNDHVPAEGEDATVSYMKSLPRAAEPGAEWSYKTGETNLIGVLVSEATGKTLAEYLSEKIWTPFGMEQDATWLLSSSGKEISGCCIQAATRDFARYGQFILGGAMAGGESVVPDDWLATATTKQAPIGAPGRGYGFQWWTNDDGSFAAQGIFGQGIFIDPSRNLVIASNGNWPVATDYAGVGRKREEFYRAVQGAIEPRGVNASD